MLLSYLEKGLESVMTNFWDALLFVVVKIGTDWRTAEKPCSWATEWDNGRWNSERIVVKKYIRKKSFTYTVISQPLVHRNTMLRSLHVMVWKRKSGIWWEKWALEITKNGKVKIIISLCKSIVGNESIQNTIKQVLNLQKPNFS